MAQPLSGLEAHGRGWVWGSRSRDSREKGASQPRANGAVLGLHLPLAKTTRNSQRSAEWEKRRQESEKWGALGL